MDKPGQAGDMMDNRKRLTTCPQPAPTCPQQPAYGLTRYACQTTIFSKCQKPDAWKAREPRRIEQRRKIKGRSLFFMARGTDSALFERVPANAFI